MTELVTHCVVSQTEGVPSNFVFYKNWVTVLLFQFEVDEPQGVLNVFVNNNPFMSEFWSLSSSWMSGKKPLFKFTK